MSQWKIQRDTRRNKKMRCRKRKRVKLTCSERNSIIGKDMKKKKRRRRVVEKEERERQIERDSQTARQTDRRTHTHTDTQTQIGRQRLRERKKNPRNCHTKKERFYAHTVACISTFT